MENGKSTSHFETLRIDQNVKSTIHFGEEFNKENAQSTWHFEALRIGEKVKSTLPFESLGTEKLYLLALPDTIQSTYNGKNVYSIKRLVTSMLQNVYSSKQKRKSISAFIENVQPVAQNSKTLNRFKVFSL